MRGVFTCLALACLAASVAAQQKVLVLDYEHEQEEFSTLSGAPFSFGGASFTVEGERPQPALRTPQDAGTTHPTVGHRVVLPQTRLSKDNVVAPRR